MQFLRTMLLVTALAAPAVAQRAPVTAPVDPELEKLAEHNLKIADYYFSKRKAYSGAKDRLLEVATTYPEYTKIDRVYFLLGEVYVKTSEPDKAREYFQMLVDERPQSELAERARERLAELAPSKPAPDPAPQPTKP